MHRVLLAVGMSAFLGSPSLSAQAVAWSTGKFRHGQSVQLVRDGGNSPLLKFSLGRYSLETVMVDGQLYTRLEAQGGVLTTRKGFGEVPFYHASLQVAPDRIFRAEIQDEHCLEIPLPYPLLPSKGVCYRNQALDSVPLTWDPLAVDAGFFPERSFREGESFIYRDVKGQNFYFQPFQYDAARRVLRVTSSLCVRLEEEAHGDEASVALVKRGACPPLAEMEAAYRSLLLNYQPRRWPNELREIGDLLVITTPAYQQAIAPYVAWKRSKGFQVSVREVSKGTHVKALIKEAYDANKNLLYVQLVGDWADLQCDKDKANGQAMDPELGMIVGEDAYPEIVVGRFSASSPADVTAQVNKVLNYEKKPELNGEWYKSALMIASREGLGRGDDKESDTDHAKNIVNGRLKPLGFKKIWEAYDPFFGKADPNIPVNAFNGGVSLVNYTGHGDVNEWGTSKFNSGKARSLRNGNRLPVVLSVACLTGQFEKECLAEALLRNPNGGAIAGIFSTINQPWAPPMRGQDYFNDLLAGGYSYDNKGDQKGVNTTYGKSIYGALVGNMVALMLSESNDKYDVMTAQTWTNFGDITLQVRSDMPRSLELSEETVAKGAYSCLVLAGGQPVKDALVALSAGETVCSGLTDDQGRVTLNHGFQGEAALTVSAKNATVIEKCAALGCLW